MRQVECKRITYGYENNVRNKQETTVTGLFHCWGSGYEEFENGPGNYTVAIVELDDGSIEEFLPYLVKFTSAA